MDHIENGMHGTNDPSAEALKSFLIHYGLWGENFLKPILIYLHCPKCGEINI